MNSLHQSTKEIGKLLTSSESLSLQVQSQLVSELAEYPRNPDTLKDLQSWTTSRYTNSFYYYSKPDKWG